MNPGVNTGVDAVPTWRRWAVKLVQHAARALPGARSPWAEAMRRELDYIEDDLAALHWALGCVVASYKARLAARPGFANSISTRAILRHVAASGALMLVIGFALLENAESQTEPPRPAVDGTACVTPDPPDIGQTAQSGSAGISLSTTSHPAPASDPAFETSCANRDAPVRSFPKYRTR